MRRPPGPDSPWFLLAVVLLALSSASCYDPLTPLEETDVRVRVIAGQGQVGVAGRLLPDLIVLQVLQGEAALVGVEPLIEVVGGGAVRLVEPMTDATGHLSLRWALGPDPEEPQALRIEVDGARAQATAAALPAAGGDLLLLSSPLDSVRGIVVLRDDPEVLPVEVVEVVRDARGEARLQQYQTGEYGLVVFPWRGPPVRAHLSAVPGVDTVRVVIPDEFVLDLHVDVFTPPFEDQVARFRTEAQAFDGLSRNMHWGVRLGALRFVDRTADGVGTVDASLECKTAGPTDRVRIRLVPDIEGNITGYGCTPGHVFLADDRREGPLVLAHELGHAFGLRHVESGLMSAHGIEADLTDGQIYRSHFDQASALNAAYGLRPETERRPCIAVGGCIPVEWRLSDRADALLDLPPPLTPYGGGVARARPGPRAPFPTHHP